MRREIWIVVSILVICVAGIPFAGITWMHLTGRLHHGAIAELFLRRSNAARHAQVHLDASLLDMYLGAFALDDGRVLTITRQNDRLFAQASGSPLREIFAESPTNFFYADVPATLAFQFDGATHSVSAVMLAIESRPPTHGARKK